MRIDNVIPIIDRVRTWSTPVSLARASTDDCAVVYVNPAFESQTGLTLQTLLETPLSALISKQGGLDSIDDYRRAIAGGGKYAVRLSNAGQQMDTLALLAPLGVLDRTRYYIGMYYPIARDLSAQGEAAVFGVIEEMMGNICETLTYAAQIRRELREFREMSYGVLSGAYGGSGRGHRS